MRVVLDTNIYISAILFGGNCEEILHLALLEAFETLISKDILREVDSILKDKFKWSKRQVKDVNSYINGFTTFVKPDTSLIHTSGLGALPCTWVQYRIACHKSLVVHGVLPYPVPELEMLNLYYFISSS